MKRNQLSVYRNKYDINLSILFTELPLLERAQAAASCGFDAVEYWWPFDRAVPTDREVEEFLDSIGDAGVRLVGLNLFAGDMPGGDRGVLSWPGREAELADSIDVLAGIAERTGCRAFNALYGQRRNDVTPRAQDALAIENLAKAADAVSSVGGVVLVEPLTRGENGPYPLLTAADVLQVVDRARGQGAANVAMLADVYHLARNGDDPAAVLRDHADTIGHVQLADVPGRHQPGTGTLDFAAIFATLADTGYRGYAGLEYKPDGPSADSLAWLPRDQRATVAAAVEGVTAT